MKKMIYYLNFFIEKVGKPNFILILFILFSIIVTGLYQTLSLYTLSEDLSILNGIKIYKFILNNDNTENSVTIAAGASKNIAITVTNKDKINLKYGVYYSPSNDLTNVDLGYKRDTEYLPNGLIKPNQNYIVTVQVNNHSNEFITIRFGILYGLENGGDLNLETDQHFLDQKWNFPLTEVSVGSYVKYVGNNGCTGVSCYGQNANYVNDDMGYCYINNYKYTVNGWRVEYIMDNTTYIVSAGSTDCMCTNSDGTMSNSSCSDAASGSDLYKHFNNMNDVALKYCNLNFSYGGICNKTRAWAINANDFYNIMVKVLSTTSCYYSICDQSCGYDNDLIDNGGRYWYASASSSSALIFYWYPAERYLNLNYSNLLYGVRPVLRLASSVVVTGGTGTYDDPYQISNS